MRSIFQWNLGRRSLELGKRTLIMGVINVTPDSFSDGGMFLDLDKAIEHAGKLLEEGADILDIGGESTRPGARVAEDAGSSIAKETSRVDQRSAVAASAVTAEEELRRVLPVITALKQKDPAIVVSVDTYKSDVARAAVAAGAEIVNDVSGFRWDPHMANTLAELQCGAVLMHTRGRPKEWRTLPRVPDIVTLVKQELRDGVERAISAGISRDRLVLDPGFGFGKRFEENYPLLARFGELETLGFPLLAGTSRKSFIGRMLANNGKDVPPKGRLYGTLATHTALILKGVHILRTHDVKAAFEAARVADAILQSQ